MQSPAVTPGNAEAVEAWNTVLFDKFVRYRPLVTVSLARHGTAAIERLALAPAARVVDLGCGFGDTSRELAAKLGPDGHVLGIDAAARFIASAQAEHADVPNASFRVADVESEVPGGPFDLAYSRFGTMFFSNPVAALRNVRRAVRPDGSLCMVVWRKKDANDALCAAEGIVRDLLGEPEKGDQVTCGPGPFSMASPDVVGDQLTIAGWRDIAFTRNDADLRIGDDPDSAIEFWLNLGPAGEIVRLAGEAAVARRDELFAALRGAVARYQRDDGVWAPSSTWIVTARNPG